MNILLFLKTDVKILGMKPAVKEILRCSYFTTARSFQSVEDAGSTSLTLITNGAMINMEFIIMSPPSISGREKMVTEATIRVAESMGASLKVKRGNVSQTSVYFKNGQKLFKVYNDQVKDNIQEIRLNILSSILLSYIPNQDIA